MKNKKSIHLLSAAIILLGIVATGIGLFYTTGGKPFDYVNQYGDTVKIYGNGLYKNDSYFMAPIFRGTDLSILIGAIPLLIISLLSDMRKNTLKSRMFLMSVISIFTYYSASIAFGVTYNFLLLVYIGLFSCSFFGLILAINSINKNQLEASISKKLSHRGFTVFLALSGAALILAWLPDIIQSLAAGRSLAMIENYTTSITYVIDMGIVGPATILSIILIKKRKAIGYIILGIMLAIGTILGIMLPLQSVFQIIAGIDLPIAAIVTKVASFVSLALFALFLNIKLYRAME